MRVLDLYHFGIKGMRWGIRRNQHKMDGASDDAKAAAEAKTKVKKSGVKALSNQELQALVKRMNLEQQFSQLKPPPKGRAAAKLVSEVLLNVGKTQATRLANDAAAKQLTALLKR